MSIHTAKVEWKRSTPDFSYDTYNRTHTITTEGGTSFKSSAAPDFKGDATYANPEELLAGALASCHMLTFLALAAKQNFVVDRYEDNPQALLEKNAQGAMAVTKITLFPKVSFAPGKAPTVEVYNSIHEKAHKYCFIANSVKSDFAIEPEMLA